MNSPLKRWAVTVSCVLGVGLSLHLALLKLFSLPCLGAGGCHAVIHSVYGSVVGIPVGVFGALLWCSAILVPDHFKRRALLLLVALGSAAFMGIQFFVLRGFCLYCTLHAVAGWIAFAASSQAPRKWSAAAGVVLAVAGFAVARMQVESKVESAPAAAAVAEEARNPLASAGTGLPWLGPVTAKSPAVVLSLNCPACLDLLEELTETSFADVESGPAIYFKANEQNRELTIAFLASILAQESSKQDALLASTALLLTIKAQALSSPDVAAAQLSAMFPTAAAHRDSAAEVLATQEQTLTEAQLPDSTPLLVPASGRAKAFFSTEDLFGRRAK